MLDFLFLLSLPLAVYAGWKMYVFYYFNSVTFLLLKKRIEKNVDNYNQLNSYIQQLRNSYSMIQKTDYGDSLYSDSSIYRYSRPSNNAFSRKPNVYNCSSSVLSNSRNQPFKYLCKYFNIKENEKSLEIFEKILNNFESAEDGKTKLNNERNSILRSVYFEVPVLIRKFQKERLEKELGFIPFNYYDYYFPKYVFQYVSSGGYSNFSNEIVLDIPNLNRFIQYLSEKVTFRNSIQGQRALMTSRLRKFILSRDNYTCQNCGNSTSKEPNLLLEVDHIQPISKGGFTTEGNLQTLCWKCNRTKGAKLIIAPKSVKPIISIQYCGFCGKNTIDDYGYCNSCGMDNKGINKEIKIKTQETINAFKKEKENEENVIVENKSTQKTNEEKVIINKFADAETEIYLSGQYVVGEHIPKGRYVMSPQKGKVGSVEVFSCYEDYKAKKNLISFFAFQEDYHVLFMEDNSFVVVNNASFKKM